MAIHASPAVAGPTPADSGGLFTSVAPARLLDTRHALGVTGTTAVPAGGTVHLQVDGRGGIPATGIAAVALNVTATAPTTTGSITAWADGTPQPHASNLNFTRGQTVPNLVIAPVGTNGKIALHNGSTGTVHLIADVAGYYRGSTAPPSWGSPAVVDGFSGYLSAVSCPTATFCVAGDGYGQALTFDGQNWSAPRPVATGAGFTSISCPTTTFCAGVDSTGRAFTFDGMQWSAPAAVDSPDVRLTSVSCTSATFCAAVDTSGRQTTWDGQAWAAPQPIANVDSAIRSVSCVTPTFCAAVDDGRDTILFDGTVWSAADYGNLGQATSVSCASTSFCVAVDDGGSAVTYDGTSWSTAASVDPYGNGLRSIQCPSAGDCVATDAFQQYVVYHQGTWSDPAPTPIPVSGLSCPTAAACTAVSGGEVASLTDGVWGTALTVDQPRGGPVALSCPTRSSCTLVDANNAFVTWDGAAWSAPTTVQTGFPYPLAGLSCTSPAFCAAVTHYPVDGNGSLLTYDGNGWAAEIGQHDYVGVSCATDRFCVAVGAGGAGLFDGSTWTRTAFSSYVVGSGVSCPSTDFCAVVGSHGEALTYDGSTWSPVTTIDKAATPGRMAVSCASSSFCVAVDANGNAFDYDGTSWSGAIAVDPASGGLTGISCPSDTFCVAVDERGNAVSRRNGHWSAPVLVDPDGGGLVSVSCPSTVFCAVADRNGRVTMYS